MKVWRIVHAAYVETAFTGVGAEQTGGRFNSKGRRVVYTAGSIALAVLEILVQVNQRHRLAHHVCISASIDDTTIETLDENQLPEGWDARPYTRLSQHVGDRWLDEQRSLVLRIPSIVIPQEYNYLINPAHPDFATLEVGKSFPAPFDQRLMQ